MAKNKDEPTRDDYYACMDPAAYLERIGVDPETVGTPDLETLTRIQRAHVTSVAFENLSIVGDPYGDRDGDGVVLSVPRLYEKIVEDRRGGYCFELNGLFHWILDELGYDVDRVAARVLNDGAARPPANHLTNVVRLDRRYVSDVGMGIPVMRRPIPLVGASRTDAVDTEWRIRASDRPDETYCAEYRTPKDDEWSKRYVFSDVPRELCYFEATNEYLQTAPESPFTGDPVVSIATREGHRKLSGETLTEMAGSTERERKLSREEWYTVVTTKFGLQYGTE